MIKKKKISNQQLVYTSRNRKKETQSKPKTNRRKEIIKIRDNYNRKHQKKINETKSCFLKDQQN